MICFNCGYKLPSSDSKECSLCGMKFPSKCKVCGSPNPMMAKFCFNCGAKIGSQGERSSIQNFDILPESRKNVAVLFADVSGFTALSEKMDPEEVRGIINDCFDYITKPVYELEGTIDKYIGDAVMVLFGAKYPHADDPIRAVVCAMKMMELINKFSKEVLHDKGVNLSLSIGVNYGLVVTGSVGNYFDKDYTVIGDTVNTAQRLQSSAARGEILVSQSVYEATKDVINYSDPREIVVKNKEKPVKCYVPIGIAKDYGKDDIQLVERDHEINFLNTIFRDAQNSKVIFVLGEVGLGKTSLIKKFTSDLDNNIKRIWINSDPTYQRKAYHLISNILYNVIDVNPETDNNTKKARLMSYVGYILKGRSKDEVQRNYDFLAFVMGLDRSKDFQDILNSMEYHDIKRELINQLSIFIKGLCMNQQVVFIVDDLQFADSVSVDILIELIKLLSEVKTTFIFTSTYEIEAFNTISPDRIYTLKLKKLSKEGVSFQICQLLGCKNIDGGLNDEIYQLTNGNPLYVREFVNAVKREGKFVIKNNTVYFNLQGVISLPGNLESIILSNLSGLDEATTRFLEAASVIGKEFNLSWVRSLLDVDEDEMERLIKLPVQLNIISPKSVRITSGAVDRVYMFEIDTAREVIYNSILNRNKQYYHRKLGEMIESRYRGELEYFYEILCMHFEAAGLNKKAEEYYRKTAEKYKRDFNYDSALEYYDRYLQAIKNEGDEPSDSKALHAYMDIGEIYFLMAEYDRALEYLNLALKIAEMADDIYSIKLMIAKVYEEKAQYNEALKIIEEIEHRIRQNSSLYGKLLQQKCSIFQKQGNPKALEIAEKSEEILLRNKDYENLSETLNRTGILYYTRGDMENALFYLNKAYNYAEKINNFRIMANESNNLGIIYHAMGMISKAQEYFNNSIELSKKISNLANYISSSINLGILYLDKGLFRRAEQLFMESMEKAYQISSMYKLCLAQLNMGDLMYEIGDFAKAFEYYNKSLEIAESRGLPVEAAINYLGIARLNLKLGNYEKVPGMLENAYKIFTDAEEISYISDYYRYRSIYELQSNNLDTALEYCNKSISAAMESRNDMKKLKALRLKGIILANMGDYAEALQMYEESIQLALQLESDYEAAKGFYRRHSLFYVLKRYEEARQDLEEARKAIGRIDKCRWTQIIQQSNYSN